MKKNIKPLSNSKAKITQKSEVREKVENISSNDLSNKSLNVVSAKTTVRKVNNGKYRLNNAKNRVSNNVVLESDVKKKTKENIQHVSTLNTLSKITAKTVTNNSTIINKSHNKNISKTNVNDTSKKIAKTTNKRVTKTNSNRTVSNIVKDSIKNKTNKDDNISVINTTITAGEVTAKAFKYSQKASDFLVKKSKGIYSVSDKTIKVVRKSNHVVSNLKSGKLQLNHETYLKMKSVALSKIRQTNTANKLNHAVSSLKTSYKKTVALAQKTKYVYIETNRKLKIVRGITNGTFKIQVNRATLAKIKNKSIKAISKSSILVGRTLKTGAKYGLKTGAKINKKSLATIRKGYKGLKIGIVKASDYLSDQDDLGVQALGNGIKYGNLTVKGIKVIPKVAKSSVKKVKTAVNIPIKTGRSIGKFVSVTKDMGIKRTMAWQRKKAIKSLKKTGGSIVSTVIEWFKGGIKKAILPLTMLISILVLITFILQGTCGGAYQVMFGSTATDKDTGADIEEQQWLTQKITASRNDLVLQVKSIYNNNLKSNGGIYDNVRLFNSISNQQIDLTDVNILSSVYSVPEYLEYIQPIFHVILLTKYDLEPTQYEMEQVYNEIWKKLTKVTTRELPTEYCNGGNKEADGNIHADLSTCPNHSEQKYHTDDSNAQLCSCDYYYYECLGHKGKLKCNKKEHKHDNNCHDNTGKLTCTKEEHIHSNWVSKDNEGCYNTNFCSTNHMSNPCSNSKKHLGCNGYCICNGHKILGVYITVGNFNDLLNEYFNNRINELEAKTNRTSAEEKELQELKENHQICLNYIEAYTEEHGGGNAGGGVVDLSGVELTQITEFACQFVGNPYVYGGTDINNGIDCSAFVQYVYAHFGISLPRTTSQQCSYGTLVPSLAEAKAGDLIFYSDDGTDIGTYHVTMYLGNGKMVHASNSKPYPAGGIKISNVYGTPYKIKRIVQ